MLSGVNGKWSEKRNIVAINLFYLISDKNPGN
jgi:hypothetical protein